MATDRRGLSLNSELSVDELMSLARSRLEPLGSLLAHNRIAGFNASLVMSRATRVLGGFVGLLQVLAGTAMVYRGGGDTLIQVGGSFAVIAVGCVFLRYAITGKPWPPRPNY